MKFIRRDVLALTLPVITEQVFTMSMGVINTIMAGNIGKEAVSAIGMVDSISNIFIAFISALAVGGTVVVAHYAGQGNINDANEAARQSLLSGFFLTLGITVAIWVFRLQVIRALYGSAEADVMKNALIYMKITILTYPLISITSIAFGVLRGAGDTKTPMNITIGMNILNIILSYILIYGIKIRWAFIKIKLDGLGVKGAALGISFARVTGAAVILYILLRGSKTIKLTQIYKIKLNMDMQKSIFGIGIPSSIESLLFSSGKLITQVFIVGMGTSSIASNYIAGSVFSLINIPGTSLSVAATTLVGQSMGRNDSEEAERTLKYLTIFSSVCLLILCVLSFPFAEKLVSLYTKDDEIIKMSARLIRYSNIVVPIFWPISFVLPAGLKGAGDARYTMVTSIIGMWAFRITLGYIIGVPLKFGVAGVWMGMYIDWMIRGTMYVLRLKSGKWKKNVVIRQANEAIL